MTAALALAGVAVAAVVVLAAVTMHRMAHLVDQAHALTVRVLHEDRLERERMLRAIIAKTTGELANLERIEGAVRKAQVQAAADGASRQMTPAEYERWLRADLEGMDIDPAGVPMPTHPEGM